MAGWRRLPGVDAAADCGTAAVQEATCRPLRRATRGSVMPLVCRAGCDGSAQEEGRGGAGSDYRGTMV